MGRTTSRISGRGRTALRAGVIAAVLVAVVSCVSIAAYVVQYQSLADDEPDVALHPTQADVTYCTMDGTSLKLDLYLPKNSAKPPYPVLVYLHGGSFTGGDKRKGSGIIDIPAMTARGYAVAAVNYRLMPAHPFPAAVLDAKCAVRFLRAHADEYQLATTRIGIWGGSAGGYLATMVGLTTGRPEFEAGEYPEQSSSVQAVTEMFGPTDLTAQLSWLQTMLLRRAFGTVDRRDPLLLEASPIHYVHAGAPPFLILHGEQDGAVPVAQATLLYSALTAVQVDASITIVKNANHNFKPTGGAISPGREEISAMMADFFDQWIGRAGE